MRNDRMDPVKKKQKLQTRIIGTLQDIQAGQGYLSRESMEEVSKKFEVPVVQVYSLATFYRSFRLEPCGRHIVHVCLGTACHVKGAERILGALERKLKVKQGGTTEDRRFSVETVRCVGACSLAPVVIVDSDTYGDVRQDKVDRILRKYS